MIVMRLPYPVSANRYWRTFVPKGGKRAITHLSKEAAQYKRTVGLIALEAGIRKSTERWVNLDLWVHPMEPKDAAARARKIGPGWPLLVSCIDIDNALKVTCDALEKVAYENDKQIIDLRIRRGAPVPNGGMTAIFDTFDPEDIPKFLEQSPAMHRPSALALFE